MSRELITWSRQFSIGTCSKARLAVQEMYRLGLANSGSKLATGGTLPQRTIDSQAMRCTVGLPSFNSSTSIAAVSLSACNPIR